MAKTALTEDNLNILNQAVYFLGAGRPAAALRLLEPAAENSRGDPSFALLLAQAYSATSQHGKAESSWRVAAKAFPHSPDVQFMLGRVLFKSGRHQEALPFLMAANKLRPDHAPTAFLVGMVAYENADYETAHGWVSTAVALDPTYAEASRTLGELAKIVAKPPAKKTFARWPQSAAQFDDVPKLIREFVVDGYDTGGFTLEPGMGLFTQGSCFAGNIARSLSRYQLRVGTMECGEEHNSTAANCSVIDWLRNGVTDENSQIVEDNLGSGSRETYLRQIQHADLFVYTLGLAPAHCHRTTGEFMMCRNTKTAHAAMWRDCTFVNTSVAQNVNNLKHLVDVLREIAPKIKIILTVSPVPLRATSEFKSAVIADCVSKSTLRAAVHEYMTERPGSVSYWPSFEIIRWLGGHVGRVYGSDDGSSHHPDRNMVDHVVDAFVERFGSDALRAPR